MKKKKQPLYLIAFIVYLVLMIKFLVLKQPLLEIKNGFINLSLKGLWEQLSHTQWMPFKTIIYGYNHQTIAMFIKGIGQNLVWFIPTGFFLPHWYKKHGLFNILIIGMIGGFILELFAFLALGYPLRIDPILLAGIGTSIGYGIYKLL